MADDEPEDVLGPVRDDAAESIPPDDANGSDSGDSDGDPAAASSSALARARRAARERGLRPGAPIARRRKAGEIGRFSSASGRDGRDPAALSDQLDRLLRDRDWRVDVAAGSVMGRWVEIVGPDISQHATPVSFELGILTVRAESTAWATQLRWLNSVLIAKMDDAVGAGVVTEMKVVGPSAPSWKKGPRSVRDGRGPRDTYG